MATDRATRGTLLEELTWVQAENALNRTSIVVVPIGAAAKEHGPHLKLKTDRVLADYLKARILERCEVLIVPTLTYHYYPAFLDYPGSTTLRLKTARDLTIDVCKSVARYGPRRFYALNTGVSTIRALKAAATSLAHEGILLRFTDISKIAASFVAPMFAQKGGTHADELETSMMLYIEPTSVDMTKAACDYHPGNGPLRRTRNGNGVYSPTGIYGDATLATRSKGKRAFETVVQAILRDIKDLRGARLHIRSGE
jgi:creatinine amidohydrolase